MINVLVEIRSRLATFSKILFNATGLAILVLFIAHICLGQCADLQTGCDQKVPRLLKFNGTLLDSIGHPRTGTAGILFAIYADATSGAPLWQEVQTVRLDNQGHYSVLLGSTTNEGVPLTLFRSGDSRWLSVQAMFPGEQEQQRVLLVSVPYALKAADAETLGGLPPSAFVRAGPQSNLSTAVTTANAGPTTVVPLGATAQNHENTPTAALPATPVTTPGGANNILPKFSGSSTIINSQIMDSSGIVTLQNLANVLFADQFPDGVPGAVAACPAAGCTIYAGGGGVNRNLGSIDPGSKTITIYLGPFTYNVRQITLRQGLRIIGMGGTGASSGTILQSVNGNNPVFVIPQKNAYAATGVMISGLQLVGSVGNTSEDAIFSDASSLADAGLWYSSFSDLFIQNFAGSGVHLRGPNSNFGAANQWLQFNNIVVFRTAGGGNALRIEGANFQLHFTNCEFDGQGIGDGTNIYIGGLPGGVYAFPFDITFRGLVSQTAALAVQLDGAATITFQTSHHESLWGGFLITDYNNIATRGVTIADSVFNPNVGVNNGAGYLLKVATTNASGVYFLHNRLGGAGAVSSPDSVVSATNLSQVVYQDNEYLGSLNVPPTSGITTQISPAPTINIGGAHTVGLAPSTTPISTIQSSLGPGEIVTFATLGGSVTFASGGNIFLAGTPTVIVNGTITFIRNDLLGSGNQWWPLSQWGSSTQGTPGFTLSVVGPSIASINPGGTAEYSLSVRSMGGFLGPVYFFCSGYPSDSSCTVSPTSVTLSANSPSQVAVNIPTSTILARNSLPTRRPLEAAIPGPLMGVLMLTTLGKRYRLQKKWRVMGALLLVTPFCGCGTTINPASGPPGRVTGTPNGTYTIVVTGVAANISHSVSVTLNVAAS